MSKINVMQEILETSEALSESQIPQVSDDTHLNDVIRWCPHGSVDRYFDTRITDTFLRDPYCKATRWDLWNDCIAIFGKHGIRSNLDVGCANNHFSFLCHANAIISYGVDPRKYLVNLSNSLFVDAGIKTKCAYVGNFATLNEAFSHQKLTEPTFDCVSVMNFLHGVGHIDSEISKFLELMSRHSRYIFISRPSGIESCRILDLNYTQLESIASKAPNVPPHTLYRSVK